MNDTNKGLAPQSNNLAYAVLGAVLYDPANIKIVRQRLSPDDFHDSILSDFFAAMLALDDRGLIIDLLTLEHELRNCERFDPERYLKTLEYILKEESFTSEGMGSYVQLLIEHSVRRCISEKLALLAGDCNEGADPLNVVEQLAELSDEATRRVIYMGGDNA